MVKTTVPVNVPGRSSFDKSFKNILTTSVGTITPICSRLVIPGSKGSLKIALSAALPPLASDTFMRCDLKVEAFLVPIRLLYGGAESFFTGKLLTRNDVAADGVAALPRVKEGAGTTHPYFAPGTLADYLGCRCDPNEHINAGNEAYFNIFKFLAYHRCYDDWYRNKRVQVPVFVQPFTAAGSASYLNYLRCLPFTAFPSIVDFSLNDTFHDGVHLGDLRQRNYGDDYFTIAMPSAQMGSAQAVDTSSGNFTIAALRASNSLQQYAERSGLASPDWQQFVHSHYGADLNSGVAQRSILLGSASYPVYSKGIEANSANTATNNPFATVGARYGNAFASGTDFVCNFEANEPCYLMVMATLVPEANYSSGVDKEMLAFTLAGSQVDLPDPLLENVGNEPIGSVEINGGFPISGSHGVVFGYVPRNTHHKTGMNQVHGLLRAGESLASFVACRNFPTSWTYTISSAFLQIPKTALDNVTAVTSQLSSYGVWIDSFIDLKVSEPLVECALPSLQDPAYEHGHTVYVASNGGNI